MSKVTLYEGKTKLQIAKEAFVVWGDATTWELVNLHFCNKYDIKQGCEKSMYYAARTAFLAQQEDAVAAAAADACLEHVKRQAALHAEALTNVTAPSMISPVSLVKRIKDLVADLGSYEKLEELVKVLK